MPCRMSTFTSVASECPRSAALAAAISSEIAMSPLVPGPAEGNVSTSVGLFFLRKRRFNACISRFEVTQMLTSPSMASSRCTRVAKRLRVCALVEAGVVSLRFTSLQGQMGGHTALPHYGSKFLVGNAAFPVQSGNRRHFCQRRFAVYGGRNIAVGHPRLGVVVASPEIERELLVAPLVILVGTHDALHQMVPHYVAFVEVTEADAFDIPQHVDGFHQAAAAGVGQIDLGDVAGDHRLG